MAITCNYAFSGYPNNVPIGTVQFWSVNSTGSRMTKLLELSGINEYQDMREVAVVSPESNGKMHIVFSTRAGSFMNAYSHSAFIINVKSEISNRMQIKDATIGSNYINYTPPADGLLVEGKVGIGTTTTPYAKMNIAETTALGTTVNNYVRLTQTSGNSNTTKLYSTDMLVRETDGSGWTNTSYMQGLSTIGSPTGTTLRSWIKQYPSPGTIQFGNLATTYMTVGNNVGIGTTTPDKLLTVNGTIGAKEVNLEKAIISDTLTVGTTTYNVDQTIDNIGYKINVNSTALNYKIAIAGVDKLKILAGDNYALGGNSLNARTSGSYNIGLGNNSLVKTTTGSYNIALGSASLYNNIGGAYNTALGYYSLYGNNTGSYNTGLGVYSLYGNTTGTYNVALGYSSLYGNTTGTHNIGIGYYAGRYIANGTTANSAGINSIFLGRNSKAYGNGETNQIVIGYDAIGNGSNTVTLGNDAITKTILKGKIGIGTDNPDELLTVNGTIHAKEVRIDLASELADYVFAPDYKLMPLPEVESFVKENRHLPDIPSASEVHKNGMDIGEFQNLLLQKIEELTLHAIKQQKIIEKQGEEIEELKKIIK